MTLSPRLSTGLAFMFLMSGCRSEAAKGLGINLKLDQRKLSNGLKLIMVEDHTVPIISYQTWIRAGSVDEKPGKTGIAHFFEHLMFKGTPKYGPQQFFIQLEAKGAEVNAYTTRDYTVYHEDFVPDLLEKVIDMESDRMANLTLDDELLNSERMVIMEERRLRTDNSVDGKMQEALWELAFQRHPYRNPVIGYPQDLMGLKLEDLEAFFKANYQPENAAIVVAGDFKADPTFQLIQKYYEKIPARPRPKRDIPDDIEQTEERRLVMHDRIASERVLQAYHVTSARDDDSYALDVLSNILFEGTGSRAYRKLVDDMDIAMGVSGSDFTPTYPGLFIISASMKNGVPASQAEEALAQVIHEVQSKGVTAEEITTAVKQLTVELVDGVRTSHGLAQLIGTVQTIFGNPDRYADDLAKYLKVTAPDVQRVAAKYLIPNNRSVVTVMPEAK